MTAPFTRDEAFAAINSERNYQDMRKGRDSGNEHHPVEAYVLFMEDYLQEARAMASRTWGPDAKLKTLDIVRKVVALGIACMEHHGAPQRAGFEQYPIRPYPERPIPQPPCAENTARTQVYKLADFIMREVPGEPSESEGAVDCAIRIIKNHLGLRKKLGELPQAIFGDQAVEVLRKVFDGIE